MKIIMMLIFLAALGAAIVKNKQADELEQKVALMAKQYNEELKKHASEVQALASENMSLKAVKDKGYSVNIPYSAQVDDAMNRIRIPSINFSQTSISKVVSTLNSISKDVDSEKEGVNLVILEPENIDYKVSASVQNISYKAALELILKGSNLEYKVAANFVIIQKIIKDTAATSSNIHGNLEMASQEQKRAIFTIKIKDRASPRLSDQK